MAKSINEGGPAPKPARQGAAKSKAADDAKSALAGAGHNSGKLTPEEKGALLSHHIGELRKLEAEVEVKRSPFKAAQEAVTAQFNKAKSELGKNYSRKYLQGLMEDVGARLRNVAATEEQRFQDRIALGLPVFGKQLDLFGGAKTDTEKDAIAAEADGYMAGRRADEAKPPADIGPLTQDWMRGYHKGQEETAQQVAKAMEVRARGQKAAAPKAPEKDPQQEVEDQARKLKKSGFMNTTAPAEPQAAA